MLMSAPFWGPVVVEPAVEKNGLDPTKTGKAFQCFCDLGDHFGLDFLCISDINRR
jgi:hypothetical protein